MIDVSQDAVEAAAPLFQPPGPDRTVYERIVRKPLPERRYVIMFTPRSGSTWLTGVVRSTKRLGSPGEHFNPNFIKRTAYKWGSRDLREHTDAIMRNTQSNGTFGAECTFGQVERTFGSAEPFLDLFGAWPMIWLIRRDIVAQAVSLHKMVTTDAKHSSLNSAEALADADAAYGYDADGIERWLHHIAKMEHRTEEMFAQSGIEPLRLSYERNTSREPFRVVRRIGNHVGVPIKRRDVEPLLAEKQTKIGTSRNEDYAARFREDHPRLVALVETEREETVRLLTTS